MALAALLVAIGGLGVSLLLYLNQRRQGDVQRGQGNVQNDLQARLTEIEEARHRSELAARSRASVRASVEYRTTNTGSQGRVLVLRNDGPAIATEVTFRFVVPERDGYSVRLQSSNDPIARLAVGHEFPMTLFLMGAVPTQLSAVLGWTDEQGVHSEEISISSR